MKATTFETESSHVPMLSQPDFVLDVIRKAAKAVMEKSESLVKAASRADDQLPAIAWVASTSSEPVVNHALEGDFL